MQNFTFKRLNFFTPNSFTVFFIKIGFQFCVRKMFFFYIQMILSFKSIPNYFNELIDFSGSIWTEEGFVF